MLAAVHNLKTGMEDNREMFKGKIHFATQQSIASLLLAPILAEFSKEYPQIKTSFRLGRTINVKSLLDQRDIEFGITMDNIDYGTHTKIPLKTGKFVFLATTKKPRSEQEFLLTENTSEVELLQQLYLQKHGKEIPVSMRVHSWSVLKQLAIEGYGIGFLPDYLVGKKEEKYLVKNLGYPPFQYTLSCVHPKGYQLNQKTIVLLEKIKLALN